MGCLDVFKEIIFIEDCDKLRFNDGGVDVKGRFWFVEIDIKVMSFGFNKLFGSYGKFIGWLWRYDLDGSF